MNAFGMLCTVCVWRGVGGGREICFGLYPLYGIRHV